MKNRIAKILRITTIVAKGHASLPILLKDLTADQLHAKLAHLGVTPRQALRSSRLLPPREKQPIFTAALASIEIRST